MDLVTIIVFIIAGAISGGLAGLLGLGGGIFIVPFLVYELPALGINNLNLMQIAVGTSLSIVVFTSLSSAFGHYRNGTIQWPLLKGMLIGIFFGAISGGYIAHQLPGDVFRLLFGFFVLLVAYRIAFPRAVVHTHHLPGKSGLIFAGFIIANFCTLLGIGGGSLMVPYFLRCNVPIRNAVATSATAAFPLAVTAVLVLMLESSGSQQLPADTYGYVYWPAFLAMVVPSVICAPLGAKLTTRLPVMVLRRIFACFLILVGIDMLSKAIGYIWHLL